MSEPRERPQGRLFKVSIEGGDLAPAGERKVIFHGVNKSGSLAMADVMLEAYTLAGREDQFVSTYHNRPREFAPFAERMMSHAGHGFFVSHYIYNGAPRPPDSLLVTQFRHPVSRAFSVHGWLKRNYIRRHGSDEGYPSFKDWVARTRGITSTQMWQFGVGFDANGKSIRKRIKGKDLLRQCIENIERDVVWYGIAELFEDSIYAMAHLCGIEWVPAWVQDNRNKWRIALEDAGEGAVALVEEVFQHDMALYEYAVANFRRRIAAMSIGGEIDAYRQACAGAYKERLIS